MLEGRRGWPTDLPVDVFFSQVMRSIADVWWQRAWREPFLEDLGTSEIEVSLRRSSRGGERHGSRTTLLGR